MTHVLLLVHPRADNAGLYCAASVLLRTRFLVWAVSNLGEVIHGPNRSATLPPPPLLRHSPLSRNLQRVSESIGVFNIKITHTYTYY